MCLVCDARWDSHWLQHLSARKEKGFIFIYLFFVQWVKNIPSFSCRYFCSLTKSFYKTRHLLGGISQNRWLWLIYFEFVIFQEETRGWRKKFKVQLFDFIWTWINGTVNLALYYKIFRLAVTSCPAEPYFHHWANKKRMLKCLINDQNGSN